MNPGFIGLPLIAAASGCCRALSDRQRVMTPAPCVRLGRSERRKPNNLEIGDD